MSHPRKSRAKKRPVENMHIVTLECRNCETNVEQSTPFMADEKPTQTDMQFYFDRNFLAQCWHCCSRNWDVVAIKEAVCPHGALDIVT